MRWIFPCCCASTGKQSAKSIAQRVRTVIFLFMFFSTLPTRHSTLAPSFDHPIRSHQHIRRDRQADLLRGFQIDDKLEFLWLLHREVGRLSSFQDLVDVVSSAAEQVGK